MKNTDMKKDMIDRGEKLLDAIGDIRDEYIVEAGAVDGTDYVAAAEKTFTVVEGTQELSQSFTGESEYQVKKPRNKKRIWIKVTSAAAALLLCVGVGSMALRSAKEAYPAINDAAPPTGAAYEESSAVKPGESSGSDAPAEYYGGLEEKAEAATSEGATAPTFNAGTDLSTEAHDETVEYPIDEPVGDPVDDPFVPYEPTQGEAFVLTAAQWNDNDNWPFFINLVNSGIIGFPSYGIDPRNRVKVTVQGEAGEALKNEEVLLLNASGDVIWKTKTDKAGIAYLFAKAGETPASVSVNGEVHELLVEELEPEDQQGTPVATVTDEITVTASASGEALNGVQVMFIVDTTGSMGDELSYLQMDFSQIAADTAGDGVVYSANFYRDAGDAYVTKTNGFTSDVAEVQRLISDEYAAGGGDTPEAVADILYETITANGEWRSDMNKVCFLIFDAPPHYGTEDRIVEAVESAAARGIHIVPVVASNAERETELFGRALAICTDGEYVFLTDDSGVGLSHLEPIIGDYSVELLHDVIVRIINSYK